MKKQCQKTTIEIERQEDFYQTYTRIDQNDNFYSKLKLTHQKQANSDLLSVNASLYKGLLTKGLLASCLVEMQSDLTADQITSLKLIGLTDKNCEPELFRKSSVRSVHDSSFSNLREVVIESAYPQNMPADLQTTSTLPSKPFMRADLDFLKIDGQQIVPENFLSNANRVGMLICPDNQNTHKFLTSATLDNVFATSQPQFDTTQNIE